VRRDCLDSCYRDSGTLAGVYRQLLYRHCSELFEHMAAVDRTTWNHARETSHIYGITQDCVIWIHMKTSSWWWRQGRWCQWLCFPSSQITVSVRKQIKIHKTKCRGWQSWIQVKSRRWQGISVSKILQMWHALFMFALNINFLKNKKHIKNNILEKIRQGSNGFGVTVQSFGDSLNRHHNTWHAKSCNDFDFCWESSEYGCRCLVDYVCI
jgi:hypothetical protein